MATYLAHDALRLPAASLLANSGLCVNIEIKIWLLLGVNVDTAYFLSLKPFKNSGYTEFNHGFVQPRGTEKFLLRESFVGPMRWLRSDHK